MDLGRDRCQVDLPASMIPLPMLVRNTPDHDRRRVEWMNREQSAVVAYLSEEKRVLREQLNGWMRDTYVWPEGLTREMFLEWFDCELSTMICYMLNTRINRTL